MSITYEQALATLSSMFGPPWTPETLGGVLRHNKGHMERTVDAVLSSPEGVSPEAIVSRLVRKG